MTGRGIDQILPNPGKPLLYERVVTDARNYVRLGEIVNGPLSRPVSFGYIWGDALKELDKFAPDFRIINLETAVTRSDTPWPNKEVLYRMNPENIGCLKAAGIDCCTLANNHLLDWGYEGLKETLHSLKKVKIKYAGAGLRLEEAQQPAILDKAQLSDRVLVFALGSVTSGVPYQWAAGENKAGVNLLSDFSSNTRRCLIDNILKNKRENDFAVLSIHWGSNWGYEISSSQKEFAHELIDAGIDIIWGHSSHHVRAVEIYKGKPVLYGCGDFFNDYEGIGGYEEFRGDLSLMYFVTLEKAKPVKLQMIPMQIKKFRLNRAGKKESGYLHDLLNREGIPFGTKFSLNPDGSISAQG